METSEVLSKGNVEKIGLQEAFVNLELNGDKIKLDYDVPDHTRGIEHIVKLLVSDQYGPLKQYEEIKAVGHRVVHGGEQFSDSVLVDREVMKAIESLSHLAPLHNPNNLKGIYAIEKLLPNVPQVAVFDTAFHQTMPDYAYMYGLPYEMYEKHGVRRYGFHGTSHRYVLDRACEILNVRKEDKKIVTCHLGNGASIAAIDGGTSIDTSMGLTPVEGLIMGTRTGDLDLGAVFHIMDKEHLNVEQANHMINKESGMLGVTGVSPDMREIREAVAAGNRRAELGLKMYDYRIKKYIGGYAAAMNGLDIIVMTGGVGENDYETRAGVLTGMEYLGIRFDPGKNERIKGKELVITADDSNVTALIVPTNEELVIAKDTREVIERNHS